MAELKKKTLTSKQAVAMLADGEQVHAYVNPAEGVLLGASWDRESVVEYIKSADSREVAGPYATKMKHGLGVFGQRGLVFFETKSKKKATVKVKTKTVVRAKTKKK
jgi:hypothetical protein